MRLAAVNEIVEEKLETQLLKSCSQSLAQIMSMPLAKAYDELLTKFRVKRHSLRKEGKPENAYDHHYANQES